MVTWARRHVWILGRIHDHEFHCTLTRLKKEDNPYGAAESLSLTIYSGSCGRPTGSCRCILPFRDIGGSSARGDEPIHLRQEISTAALGEYSVFRPPTLTLHHSSAAMARKYSIRRGPLSPSKTVVPVSLLYYSLGSSSLVDRELGVVSSLKNGDLTYLSYCLLSLSLPLPLCASPWLSSFRLFSQH